MTANARRPARTHYVSKRAMAEDGDEPVTFAADELRSLDLAQLVVEFSPDGAKIMVRAQQNH